MIEIARGCLYLQKRADAGQLDRRDARARLLWFPRALEAKLVKGMTTRFFGVGDAAADDPSKLDATGAPPPGETAPDEVKRLPVSSGEARHALLIGNAQYASAPLANPVRDIRHLGRVLEALGFAVLTVENANLSAMREALDELAARLIVSGQNAVALVYFAGHGIQDSGINYLLPIDAELPTRAHLEVRTLSLNQIVNGLARGKRKASVIVLDACRNASQGIVVGERHATEGLAALQLPPDGMLVVYSTAAGTVAQDGNGALSPYAEALAQSLPGVLEPDRRLHDVFVEAAERVKTATDGAQAPALYLQGALPPLTITEADRERYRTYDFTPPRSFRERALQWVGAGALVAILLAAPGEWVTAYPETRALRLHRLGLIPSEMFEFSCSRMPGTQDKFGLTPSDWCRKPLPLLLDQVKANVSWQQKVVEPARDGDIAAMTLLSEELGRVAAKQGPGSPAATEATELALRAARAGWMPAWDTLLRHYGEGRVGIAKLNQKELSEGLYRAANAGILPAQINVAYTLWTRGSAGEAEAMFERADDADETGYAARRFAELLAQGAIDSRRPPDAAKAIAWLKHACRKGDAEAFLELETRVKRGESDARLGERDREVCITAALQRPGSAAAYLRAYVMLSPGPRYDPKGALPYLRMAAEAGDVNAMLTLAGDTTAADPEEGFKWAKVGADLGQPKLITAYGMYHATGILRRDGKPFFALDTAKQLLQRAADAGDANGAMMLAELLVRGTFGEPDWPAALDLARRVIVSDLASAADRNSAEALIERKKRIDALGTGDPPFLELGKPNALIDIDIRMPFGCLACTEPLAELLTKVVERYAGTGLIRIKLGVAHPLYLNGRSASAAGFIACVSEDRRLDYVIELFRRQNTWLALPDASRLDELRRITYQFAASCPLDEAAISRARANGQSDMERWGVGNGPEIVISGTRLKYPNLENIQIKVYEAARYQDRFRLEELGLKPSPAQGP